MKNNHTLGAYIPLLSEYKQVLRTMKVTLILLIPCVSVAFGSNLYSQSARVTLNISNSEIGQVIQQIEQQTDYLFVYNSNVDISKKVSVKATNKPTSKVLSDIFANTEVMYSIQGNNILLHHANKNAQQSTLQNSISVSGTVVDTQGETIIGASVTVKNSSEGTITDIDGKFKLNAKLNDILIISYLGYNTQEIIVKNSSELLITLEEHLKALEEVVVVGYGVQKKVNMTGAVVAIGGEELAKRPVVNVTQSLQGLVPGLNVSTSSGSGKPGGSLELNIRGKGNLDGGDTPYVLVDGLEMGLGDVNPNDIESISVLKDAAAAAIYGAKAAYGVILITTKKGKEGKVSIAYNGNIGWSRPVKLPDMVNSYEFAKFFNAATYNAIGTKQYSDEKLALLQQYVKNPTGMNSWAEISSNGYEEFENSAKGLGNTDYFALHYKNAAVKHSHNISVTGGSERMQFYVSGAMYNEDGILRYADMNFRRVNLNANLTSDITKWMKVKVNTKFARSKNKSPFGDGALNEGMFFHNLARFRPTVSPYDLYGNFTELSQIPYLQSGTESKETNSNIGILTGMEFQPVKDWRIFIDYNYRKGTTDTEATAIPATIVGVNGETYLGVRSELGVPRLGSYQRSNANSSYNTVNAYTNYVLKLNEKHNFVVLLGYQQEVYSYDMLKAVTKDLLSTSTPGISLGSGDKIPTEGRTHWATRGVFGRLNYDYDSRYLFEINARYDGSSRFHKDNRWGWFPSVSAGWNIANEKFMTNTNEFLSILKLRGSFGYLGNQAGAGLYTFAQTMGINAQSSWYFQNGRDIVINAPAAINLDATWEKIENINGGVDFSFWNNKLSGSFDIYQRTTRRMLGPGADYADMFGTSAPRTNNATMRNRGWELSITYRGKIGNDIDYSVGGMLSDYTAEILKFENPTKLNPSGDWYVGKKVGEIWGYRADGLIQTQEEADAYNNQYNTSYLSGQKWQPGDVKYKDLNGDNKIDRGTNTKDDIGDMEVIGNNTPRYSYSINGHISWKGINLSMLWQGVAKRDYNPTGSVYFWGSSSFAQVTVFKEHLDYWRGPDDDNPNPNAYYPRPYAASAGAIGQYTNKTTQSVDRYLQNGRYIRLKNLTISYDLPKQWTSKVGLNKVNVFFSGENLLTFTPMKKMFDPETAFSFSEGGKNYPINKVYSIGLTLNL